MKKTKSLLISIVGYPESPSNFFPDNGLASLAATLLQEGHSTEILDYNTLSYAKKLYPYHLKDDLHPLYSKLVAKNVNESDLVEIKKLDSAINKFREEKYKEFAYELVKKIEKEKIDWIGFKSWYGDGYKAPMIFSDIIKKHFPHIPIIVGGPHADYFTDFYLKSSPNIDFVAVGDGEETITKFVEHLEGKCKINEIPNLLFRQNNQIIFNERKWVDINKIYNPCYDSEIYPSMEGNEKAKIFVIEESKGCPMKCAFCLHPFKSGSKVRLKDINQLLSEIEMYNKKYNVKNFFFSGSYTNLSYFRKFCSELIEKKISINFVNFSRLDMIKDDDFSLLSKAGCKALFFGLETISQSILEKINKGYKNVNQEKVINLCKDNNIFSVVSMIYPLPGENEQTTNETMEFLQKSKPNSVITLPPLMLPNTAWYSNPQKYNFSIPSKQKYLEQAIRFMYKFMLPPPLWDNLDYYLDGKSFKELLLKAMYLQNKLKENGFLTLLTHDWFLMSKLSNNEPQEFLNKVFKSLLFGAFDQMEEIISRINES